MTLTQKLQAQRNAKNGKVAQAMATAMKGLTFTRKVTKSRVQKIMDANDTIPYLGAVMLAKEERIERGARDTIRLATNPLQYLKRFMTSLDAYYYSFNWPVEGDENESLEDKLQRYSDAPDTFAK